MRFLKLLVISLAVSAVLPVASASAGRLIVTGHDADYHCSGEAQCHFVEIATNYVRGGAPDPTKPVLVLDADDNDFPAALDNAFGVGVVPRATMDPTSAEFASEPLTTDRYSAILVASDTTCGGCDLNIPSDGGGGDVSALASETPDSDAINARKADIEAFFNAGGGIYANAGADHADGDSTTGPDVFYDFVPIPIGGVAVSPPFCLTEEGAALGFEDPGGCPDASKRRGTNDDINCCATHNSFAEPEPGTALRVAERDTGDDGIVSADDQPETLFAEGVISGGKIVDAVSDLAVSQKGTNKGNTLVYTITVTNNGPAPASGVTLTDDLPAGVTVLDIKSSQGSCSGTTSVTCSLGNLPVGGTVTIEITVRPKSSGKLTNTVRVTGNQPDPNGANNSATDERTFTVRSAARRDRTKPRVSVAGVAGVGNSCIRTGFSARFRIREPRLRVVSVFLDGKRVLRTKRKVFRVRVNAASMRSGRHRLRAVAVDRAGNRRTVTRNFTRCARPAAVPHFTG